MLKKAKNSDENFNKTRDGEVLQTSIVDQGTSEVQQEPFEGVGCR